MMRRQSLPPFYPFFLSHYIIRTVFLLAANINNLSMLRCAAGLFYRIHSLNSSELNYLSKIMKIVWQRRARREWANEWEY